jgi:phenylalanyl-tRNA synthetase alpha chain
VPEPDLDNLKAEALRRIESAADSAALEEAHVQFLGRKGELTLVLRSLGELAPDQRRVTGPTANSLKNLLEERFETRRFELEKKEIDQRLAVQAVDITLPVGARRLARPHPLTQVNDEILTIFQELGFEVADGPEIETDHYNFTALNIPKDHPARDMQDTFYIRHPERSEGSLSSERRDSSPSAQNDAAKLLLRTHTSPVQIRVMEKRKPPLRIIAPGRVYRHEATDATHSAIFHQVEGLAVEQNLSMADLKGTLDHFAKRIFGPQAEIKFRPSYFPFVEPGVEMLVSCIFCKKAGCRVCRMSGWLELLGAGMVHPNVFRGVGYDLEKLTGFAFGMGVERIAMLKYGINDIRLFYENDLRFLEQFQ